MQILDGRTVLSATDLVGQTACAHLTTLEREALEGLRTRPLRRDPVLDVLSRRGQEREARFIDAQEAAGRRVIRLGVERPRSLASAYAAAAVTRDAMARGADVLYQATLFDGRWFGRADFLVRAEQPGALAAWSYEVADAKLSREVKGGAILQLCLYSELLAGAQGRTPDEIHVITGDGAAHPYRLEDFAAYYRMVKRRLEERLAQGDETYPEPVEHCRVCCWWAQCADRRRADDHLCRVAGISRLQTRRLVAAGLPTLTALAATDRAMVPGIGRPALQGLRQQAALQARQYADGVTRYELLEPDAQRPERGLAALPAPSPGDVFLDFEADPWVDEDGREYLLGALVAEQDATADGDAPTYAAHWAHSAEEERAAFDALMGFIGERRTRFPDMHVYHYGAYEESALKRLMGRHAIRDEELDALLRGDVLVDLYAIVRQAMRISEESYSIKRVERLYGMCREGPLTRPGFALVAYEEWLDSQDPSLLVSIEAYNRDDCVSVWRLRGWLEERRRELEGRVGPRPRPVAPDDRPSEAALATNAASEERERRLRDGVPADRAARTPEQQARWLLAAFVDWHRRDARPEWWRHFDLRGRPMEDLIAAPDALGGLEYEGVVATVKSSYVHRYRYEPGQEHKFVPGKDAGDADDGKSAGEVYAVDHAEGTIDLKRGMGSTRPHPRALIPPKRVPDAVLRTAIARVADAAIACGIDGPGPYRAVRDLLMRRPPRIGRAAKGLARPDDDPVAAGRRLALALDEQCLPVQGPPGTGKTYTGARMALALVRAGRRVGITAQSHKAIGNFVCALLRAAADERVPLRVAQRGGEDEVVADAAVDRMANNAESSAALSAATHAVAAGTPWLFASSDMDAAVDVLFVDEAGQMALANVVAMGGAARSIVLLGDPNQLPQVTQGTHPDGAELSALEHVLAGRATIPDDEGLFLRETWRLHPDLCRFTSDVFYEGRLESHFTTFRQRLLEGSRLGGGAGVAYLPVPHRGNGARSCEEARVCADLVGELLRCEWIDQHGERGLLRADEILVVAPYNAHVAQVAGAIRAQAGIRARVGTVDKFQGQEGAVAIFSMATSTAEDAPRAMDFLYSLNRLNVATSRARCVAVLVCSPELLQAHCRRPEEMRMLSAFCRLAEMAAARTRGR
ncbi:MAG: nuclease [Acidobacteria bacterium]|nr:MAG: nuclease [Acidobacteriota bacterium]